MAVFNFTTSGGTFSLLIDGVNKGTWDKVDEIDTQHSLITNDELFTFVLQKPYYGNRILAGDEVRLNGVVLSGTLSAKVAQLKDDVFYNAGASSSAYLIYTALLSQSGTDAPLVTILENTTGQEITWSRTGVGAYRASGFGIVNKVCPPFDRNSFMSLRITSSLYYTVFANDGLSPIYVYVGSNPDLSVNVDLDNSSIQLFVEVRVYP